MGKNDNGIHDRLRLRIFISSPADVAAERGIARAVLRRLTNEPQFDGRIDLEEVSYDDPDAPACMDAHLTFQSAINKSKPRPSVCDVVVVILWSRLGSEIDDPNYLKPDGSGRHYTGTEWEFMDACRAAENGQGPRLWVFRRRKGFLPSQPDDPENVIVSKRDQEDKIRGFFQKTVRSYWWHAPPPSVPADAITQAHDDQQFDFLLASQLRDLIWSRLQAAGLGVPESGPAATLTLWPAHWGTPFRALEPFTARYAPVFCGRELELTALIQDVASKPFVALLGQSGSGKSSLVYAGLLPALAEGKVPGSAAWPVVSFKPGELSGGPIEGLANELTVDFPSLNWRTSELARRLRAAPENILQIAAEGLKDAPSDACLLIFIDQFEEIFARHADDTDGDEALLLARRQEIDQPQVFALLRAAANAHGRVRVVIAMRSDFCGHWPQDDATVALFNAGQRMLGTPGVAALERMIRGPAQAAGLQIGDALIKAIIEEAGSEPGSLPLMESVLSRLYELRSADNELTEATYRAIGGLTGAINDWAEQAVRAADGSLDQAALNRLFQAVASVQNVDGKRTTVRKRAPVCSLDPDAEALAQRLINARLLVTGNEQAPYVEVAHEALFSRWSTLARWLEDHGEALQLLRHMQAEAEAWQADPSSPLHQPWPAEAQSLAYNALSRLGRSWEQEAEPLRSFLRPESLRLIDELQIAQTDHFRRAAIGERLCTVGDPRPGVGVRDGLPDILWHDVPAGSVTLLDDSGTPMGEFDVPPLRVARYPVTWAQYQSFLDATDGYDNLAWWSAEKSDERPENRFRSFANHPVSRVSWFDAVAFCRWLSARLAGELPVGHVIRLPLEWEWQHAATSGDPTREYPWGDWLDHGGNTADSGLGRLVATGLYPHGAALGGPLDLAGEVLEWCANQHNLNRHGGCPGGEEAQFALRGGSWRIGRDLARCTTRLGDHPRGRYPSVGFRLFIGPILTESSFPQTRLNSGSTKDCLLT